MRPFVAFALAASVALSSAAPASAGDVKDVVRANCTKHILNISDVSRNDLKSFQIVKSGNGYKMYGPTSSGATITCETDEDGHVTWVKMS